MGLVQGKGSLQKLQQGETRLRWSWDLKPRSVFKLVAPLIGRMGRCLGERNWQNLKHFLEAQEAPGQS